MLVVRLQRMHVHVSARDWDACSTYQLSVLQNEGPWPSTPGIRLLIVLICDKTSMGMYLNYTSLASVQSDRAHGQDTISRAQLTCRQLSANLGPLAGRHMGLGWLQLLGRREARACKLLSVGTRGYERTWHRCKLL